MVLAVAFTSQLEFEYPLKKVQFVGRLEAKLTSAGRVNTETMLGGMTEMSVLSLQNISKSVPG